MSITGDSELARIAARVGNGVVALVGPRRHVRVVLAIARFDRLFIIEDGEGEEAAPFDAMTA